MFCVRVRGAPERHVGHGRMREAVERMGHSVALVVPDLLSQMAPAGAAGPPVLIRRLRQNRSAAREQPVS
jgi:hypothetical protein